jgi:predicted ATP-binding protein involved in virulence
MKIRSLRMQNFRGFEDETITFNEPLTVLVGVNGAGKTSVLDALVIASGPVVFDEADVNDKSLNIAKSDDLRNGAKKLSLLVVVDGGTIKVVKLRGQEPTVTASPQAVSEFWTLVVYYRCERAVTFSFKEKNIFDPEVEEGPRGSIIGALDAGADGFGNFFRWFRAREDVENQEKIKRKDFKAEDPQLRAVRHAVESMLPGFSGLRIERDPLHMVVSKGTNEFLIDQLSAGERGLLTLVADLARRLSLSSELDDPLHGEALVLIDEIELHLHPAWQRHVLPSLLRTFPRCQFVVTTHSPQVLSEVPTESVVLLRDFKFHLPAAPTSGRDSNAILEEVMDVSERPKDVANAFDKVRVLLDEARFDEARTQLETLRKRVTDRDTGWLRLTTELDVLERIDADDHKGV